MSSLHPLSIYDFISCSCEDSPLNRVEKPILGTQKRSCLRFLEKLPSITVSSSPEQSSHLSYILLYYLSVDLAMREVTSR